MILSDNASATFSKIRDCVVVSVVIDWYTGKTEDILLQKNKVEALLKLFPKEKKKA